MIVSLPIQADNNLTFTASAPEAVEVGDQFRLSYTVNTQKVKDIRMPSISDFKILMGPSRSAYSQSINGNRSESITFTYILLAEKEGTFTIPGATIIADGKQMISNSVKIKVLPADQHNDSGSSRQSDGRSNGSTTVSNNDLIIVPSVSKTSVYEQEAFILSYKIYTSVNLRHFDNVKLPDFKGFHSQEIELSNDQKWVLERYRGRNYQSTIYREFVLFPQQSGKQTIDAARFDASIAQAVQITDPFEAFFNGGSNYVEVKKSIITPKVEIDVKPLPAGKPSGFSGGVGDFSISSSINQTHVKTNEAISIKLVIAGAGNLKLISTPEIQFPDDFEIYDPKIDNQFQTTSKGITGKKSIEYIAIPRNAGTYRIPAVQFSFFDTKTNAYKTLTTEPYELHVEKGATGSSGQNIANYTNKEDLKVLNEDIRFIRQNKVTLSPKGEFFYGSVKYWLFYLIPALLFVMFFLGYRKHITANANITQMKTKKANKVATKRMKTAGKLLADGNKEEFYDEVLKALWGYISDKLAIPVSRLSKDNVEETLRSHGVADDLIQGFLQALNNCEFARFAPGENKQEAMDQVYHSSLEMISKMENSIKH